MAALRFRPLLVLLATFAAVFSARAATGYSDGPAPDELILSGLFAGLAPGEKRIIPRTELRALPGIVQRREKPVPPLSEADLEILPFAALLAAYPLSGDADILVLRANDRWRSYWTLEFMAATKPWLLLAIDGKTPAEGWPRIAAHEEALAPYLANISAADAPPGWDGYTPAHGMANSTQVIEVLAVKQADYFAPYFAGPLASPSPLAAEGRRLFLANCVTCHQGPGNVGGNLSRRPFMILQTHAAHNAAYFRQFVSEPTKLMPTTIMPSHPQFKDADYAALIAFLKALPPVPPPTP